MFDMSSALGLGFAFVVALGVTFIATPIVARAMRRRGIMGKDVHKLSGVEIPEMCGLAIIAGLVVATIAFAFIDPAAVREAAAFIGTVLIAGVIGVVDDLHPLGARLKPLLTALACIPILLLGTYVPYVEIPLVGVVRFTLVYPLLVPIAIAVTSNSVNMMDVMNGAMPGTVAIISFTMVALLLWSGDTSTATLATCLFGVLLAFYYYNRFPSKVFDGDTGSLSVGAALGALAIMGRIEAVTVVALIPHIMNSFYGLASVRGLRERREILQRPTRLMENGKLQASTEKNAPVTFARLILAAGPLGEREIVREMMILTVVSCVLAAFTYGIAVIFK